MKMAKLKQFISNKSTKLFSIHYNEVPPTSATEAEPQLSHSALGPGLGPGLNPGPGWGQFRASVMFHMTNYIILLLGYLIATSCSEKVFCHAINSMGEFR